MIDLPRPLRGVLFDLDGTLADSARDLYAALRSLCAELDVPLPPFDPVRGKVSHGGRAVLRCALGDDAEAIERALPRFLRLYAATGMRETRAFAGVDALLAGLAARGLTWGVVSNKGGALVDATLAKLGHDGAAAVVAGDTLPQRKPDPAPVLHACKLAAIEPAQALFVGDDVRDIEAGRAAGLFTVAAAWGYVDGADPRDWRPDAVCASPTELAAWLDGA
ncbi:MAG TPA: HAD-IA family hydrolase [Rhodanobacteraceae bacterium]